jgi:hypothetical protein
MSSELTMVAPEYASAGSSLCRQVLATEWPLLAAAVRAVHERRPVTLVGVASVVRGSTWLARLFGWVTGLPPEQHNGPVTVLLEATFKYSLEGGAIRWTAVAGRTLGVPWPDSWLKGIDASETIRGNQYYFNVRAALPVVGLVVHYVGAVDVVVP